MDITIPYYEDNSRISNSSIGWFLKSPLFFRRMLLGEEKTEKSSAMDTGSMIHMYLLQPDEFRKSYQILDVQTPSSQQQKQFCADYISSKAEKPILKALEAFKANYTTTGKSDEDIAKKGLEMALKLKAYIKWLRSSSGHRKIISWSNLNMLKVIKENVLLHKKAKELLFNNGDSSNVVAANEFHINWSYIDKKENINRDCKSLIDRLYIDHDKKHISLIDIKTTVSVSKFQDSFNEYDYGRQMGFYWLAIRWYFENELHLNIEEYTASTYIVAIQNNGMFECRVYEIPENTIIEKISKIQEIMTEINWHFTNNLWDYTRAYYEGDGAETLIYDIS